MRGSRSHGDHLAETSSPLAIEMSLRADNVELSLEKGPLAAQLPAATGKMLLWPASGTSGARA